MTPEEQLSALKYRIERLEELNLLQNNINEGVHEVVKIYREIIEELQNKVNYINKKDEWR